MPVKGQNLMVSLYGYYWRNRRLGSTFKNELKSFKKREEYNAEQWKQYQEQKLQQLLVYAFENVPYYTEKYGRLGFDTDYFKNFKIENINELPYLEKEDLRKYGKTSLLSTKKQKGKFYNSSGSTGTPVSVFFSKNTHQKWFAAYETRVLQWAGVSIKEPRGMIGGRRVVVSSEAKPPFFRYNAAEKQTYFSAYHINDKTVHNYAKGIKNNNVKFMVGYAMSNFFLAKHIIDNNIKMKPLKAVITSSEKLTREMRNTFRRAYSCKTFDSYSGVEACGLISENKFGDFLFSPDTGVLEVLNEDGEQVKNGEEGELVLTGLLNFDQPLIRYRIGDRIKLKKSQQTKSGLQMPLVSEICGRVEDVIVGEDGRKMVRFHSLFLDINELMVAQIIQESLLKITIKLVVSDKFSKKNEIVIRERLESQLGKRIQTDFQYVKEIEKNSNGKFKAVINKMKDV